MVKAETIRSKREHFNRGQAPIDPQSDLEALYNNRALVPEHPEIIAGWADRSADFRRRHQAASLDLAYGDLAAETLDLFPPLFEGEAEAEPPVLAFLHGGYWQSLGKDYFSHLAEAACLEGWHVAIIGYPLCPMVSIADITESIRRALAFLWYNMDGPEIHLAGHSAGGHLTVEMLTTDWPAWDGNLPVDLVRSGLSISGIYDLEPLIQTSLNERLGLTAETARVLSPIRRKPAYGAPLSLWVGERESEAFLEQQAQFAQTWAVAEARVVPGANHFSVLEAGIRRLRSTAFHQSP
ncbi:MAG: alpha/beta hydrolase [Magnetovibrionaceae bacterium]